LPIGVQVTFEPIEHLIRLFNRYPPASSDQWRSAKGPSCRRGRPSCAGPFQDLIEPSS
jgi:hypothetical protein